MSKLFDEPFTLQVETHLSELKITPYWDDADNGMKYIIESEDESVGLLYLSLDTDSWKWHDSPEHNILASELAHEIGDFIEKRDY